VIKGNAIKVSELVWIHSRGYLKKKITQTYNRITVCTPPQGSDKPFMVTNVNSLRELSGCKVINGSLEISMKGGSKYPMIYLRLEASSHKQRLISSNSENVLQELESALHEVEEIKGYLKITRSYPILTLGFLSSLRTIDGSQLDRGQ